MTLPWLDPELVDHKVLAALQLAHESIGVCEEPLNSNRGPEIDVWNLRAGVPVGSFWCASAAGAWWRDAGLDVPKGYASCDNWMTWAKVTGRWSATPGLGAMVLYGVPGDAKHIGLVIRVTPICLSIEGNTTIESGFSSNGIAVALKIVAPPDPILGYVLPYPGGPTPV
jgi:hypothetical protein